MRHYTSFAAYAAEMLNSTEPLPVPVVTPNDGRRVPMSLPLGTIIGVQVNFRRRDKSAGEQWQGPCTQHDVQNSPRHK